MRCLQCEAKLLEPFEECHDCGLVQSKHRPFPERPPMRKTGTTGGSDARGSLLLGTTLAVVLYLIPFTRFVFSYLSILIHELGHAATAWLFAMPAVPSLDFVYGGGVTLHTDRSAVVALALGAAWGWWIWSVRDRPQARLVLGLCSLLWLFALLTPIRDLLVVAMGHGAELLIATVFFYRAISGFHPTISGFHPTISGTSLRTAAEQPAYAFAAVFLTISNVHFSSQLLRSAWFRREYAAAKGGHSMDFTRLADDFLGIDLQWLAAAFFLLSFSPPVVAWLRFRNR